MNLEQYIQCVTTAIPAIRYLHLFSSCCLPNLRNLAKFFREFEVIAVQPHTGAYRKQNTLLTISQ